VCIVEAGSTGDAQIAVAIGIAIAIDDNLVDSVFLIPIPIAIPIAM